MTSAELKTLAETATEQSGKATTKFVAGKWSKLAAAAIDLYGVSRIDEAKAETSLFRETVQKKEAAAAKSE
jgi:hypothetical protein